MSLFNPVIDSTVYACNETNVINENVTLQDSLIQPRKDICEWRYKIVNGKMYKRLYNCTRNEWIGDWILMK